MLKKIILSLSVCIMMLTHICADVNATSKILVSGGEGQKGFSTINSAMTYIAENDFDSVYVSFNAAGDTTKDGKTVFFLNKSINIPDTEVYFSKPYNYTGNATVRIDGSINCKEFRSYDISIISKSMSTTAIKASEKIYICNYEHTNAYVSDIGLEAEDINIYSINASNLNMNAADLQFHLDGNTISNTMNCVIKDDGVVGVHADADSNNVIKDASFNVTGKFSLLYFSNVDSITNTSIYAHSSSSSIPLLSVTDCKLTQTTWKTNARVRNTDLTLANKNHFELTADQYDDRIFYLDTSVLNNAQLGVSTHSKNTVYLYWNSFTDSEILFNILEKQSYTSKNTGSNYKIKYGVKFTDVFSSDWYYDWVYECNSLGLMTGANDTMFKPSTAMNRGMVAIVLHRMEGSQSTSFKSIFPDVKKGEYYAESVVWAKNKGVINGYGDGTFRPLKQITRQEMAQMLYNFAKYRGISVASDISLSKYKDASSVSSWHKDAMKWAVGKGIISGKDNGTRLDPQGTASRAECAKMLVGAYKILY